MRLTVDKNSTLPMQEQIIGQITVLIRLGELRLGVLLPTVKELAASLNLNYNTVAAAYRTLEKKGYVVQNRRAGTRVADRLPEDPETDLLAHQTAAVAEDLSRLSGDQALVMNLLAANLALRSQKTPLRVAVLARTPLAAARATSRTQTILGDSYTCVPQTPHAFHHDFRSADYHLTVIDPDLLNRFAEPSRVAPPPYIEAHSAAFPAGAD
jgi:DNA-binding transcriptional regulator YhcF (GntR family)